MNVSQNPKVECITHEEEVGEAHQDEWEDVLRVSFVDGSVRKMSMEALNKLATREGWFLESVGFSSTSYIIFKAFNEYTCSRCASVPMYDSQSSIWYCPKCDE